MTEKAERLDHERQKSLAYALRKRDKVQQELAELDAYIQAEGKLYWKHRGYTVIPRIERLKAAILG